MKILLLVHSFNSLSQRLFVELRADGHEVSVEFDIHDDVTREAVLLARPDVVIAPYLKRAIPADVWKNTICLVVHPGIPGDRGPSALDWAILRGEDRWGVTVLQANEVMDGGDIWACSEFKMRAAAKCSLYRNEVTEGAVSGVREALRAFATPGFRPRRWQEGETGINGRAWPATRDADREISWNVDSTEMILRKVHSADSAPGAVGDVLGRRLRLFGVHREAVLAGLPGEIVARREGAICVGTLDGALWISHLRASRAELKLPATQVLGEAASAIPEIPCASDDGRSTYSDLEYREEAGVGTISFPFLNGAMSAGHCRRLLEMIRFAKRRPTRVLVLRGGEDFWCNGIDLVQIENARSPADESLRNIEALDDLAEEILLTDSHLTIAAMRGNAAAGGVFLALACDFVFARAGIVLNPHYKNMGNLYGSEYWTYSLPRKIPDERRRSEVLALRLPIGASEAQRLGLVDRVFTEESFIERRARELASPEVFEDLIGARRMRRAEDENKKALRSYREEELRRMKANFFGFDPSYHVARYNFVHRIPHARTPLHLATHRLARRPK